MNHSPNNPDGGTQEGRIYTPAPRYLQGDVNSKAISALCALGKEGSRRLRPADTGNLGGSMLGANEWSRDPSRPRQMTASATRPCHRCGKLYSLPPKLRLPSSAGSTAVNKIILLSLKHKYYPPLPLFPISWKNLVTTPRQLFPWHLRNA